MKTVRHAVVRADGRRALQRNRLPEEVPTTIVRYQNSRGPEGRPQPELVCPGGFHAAPAPARFCQQRVSEYRRWVCRTPRVLARIEVVFEGDARNPSEAIINRTRRVEH